MALYGTLPRVTSRNEFGEQVKRLRRSRLGWSTRQLAEAAGLGQSTIEKREQKASTGPGSRETVIKIGQAFDNAGVWSIEEALELAGEPPLTPEEQERLAEEKTAAAADGRETLDSLWRQMNNAKRAALLRVAAVIVDPEGRRQYYDVETVEITEEPAVEEPSAEERRRARGRR